MIGRGATTAVVLIAVCVTTAFAPAGAGSVATDVPVPLNDCARPENGDPVVTLLEVHPDAVDVSAGPAVVQVVAGVADTGGPGAASGIAEVRIGLSFGEGGYPALPLTENGEPAGRATLGEDGLWRATVTVPSGAMPGTWHAVVHAVDRLGFRRDTWDPLETDPGPSRLQVAAGPPVATQLIGLRLDRSVDTRRAPVSVPVAVRLRPGAPAVAHVRLSAVGSDPQRLTIADLRLASRTATGEAWTGRLRVPRWAGNQRFRLRLIAVDELGRYTFWSHRALERRSLPASISVTSGTDLQPPSATFLRIDPQRLDVTDQDGRLRARVRVRDAMSGVRSVTARLGPDDNGPPGEVALRRTSGSARDGIWRGTIRVHRCQPYDVAATVRLTAVDRAGQARRAHSVRQGLRVSVRWADALIWPPRTQDGLSLHFPEDVVGMHAASAVLLVGDQQQVVPGTWTCQDAAGVAVDCIRGPVRRADLHVPDPASLPATRIILLNPEHVLDVRDLAGNPYYRLEVRPGL
jgi:hypothetical protein